MLLEYRLVKGGQSYISESSRLCIMWVEITTFQTVIWRYLVKWNKTERNLRIRLHLLPALAYRLVKNIDIVGTGFLNYLVKCQGCPPVYAYGTCLPCPRSWNDSWANGTEAPKSEYNCVYISMPWFSALIGFRNGEIKLNFLCLLAI